MSEFPMLAVMLIDGTRSSIRMPPGGYRIRRTSEGWQAWHALGWRGSLVSRGVTAKGDHAAAMLAGGETGAGRVQPDNMSAAPSVCVTSLKSVPNVVTIARRITASLQSLGASPRMRKSLARRHITQRPRPRPVCGRDHCWLAAPLTRCATTCDIGGTGESSH